jgi:hypothetical protein
MKLSFNWLKNNMTVKNKILILLLLLIVPDIVFASLPSQSITQIFVNIVNFFFMWFVILWLGTFALAYLYKVIYKKNYFDFLPTKIIGVLIPSIIMAGLLLIPLIFICLMIGDYNIDGGPRFNIFIYRFLPFLAVFIYYGFLIYKIARRKVDSFWLLFKFTLFLYGPIIILDIYNYINNLNNKF